MKIIQRILKIAGYTAAIVTVLILLFALATQTRFFKDRLRAILVSSISTRINGSVQLGTIDGNFLQGFTIDSISIFSGDETILSTKKVTCQYEPLLLLEKKLKLKYLIFEQPILHVKRTVDGEWNISNVIKPTSDTNTGPFDWKLAFDDIELKNAVLTLTDSASLAAPDHWTTPRSYVEYHNFSINDMNLQMSASISNGDYHVHIVHTNFYSPQSQFELSHMRGDFVFNEKGMSVTNTIIQSARSYVEVDANLRGLHLLDNFSLENLQHDSTEVQVRAKNIDFGELKSFIPQVDFLEGSALVDLNAGGEFGNLILKHLNVHTYGSTFNLSGNMRNLHRPGDLFLDVLIGDSRFIPSDAARLLPAFHLPTFDSVGQVSFFSEYIGKPLNFKTKTSLKGSHWGIDINGEMNLERKIPTYSGTFSTKNLNLGQLLGDRKFRSSITSTGKLTGQGFSLDELTADLRMKTDSSRMREITLTNSDFVVNATPHRIEGTAHLNSQEMGALLHANADFSDSTLPKFGGDIELNAFNLATLLNDPDYHSSITLRGQVTGSGHDIDDLSAEANLTLLPSMFQGHQLSKEDFQLALDQRAPQKKSLSLRSSIADIEFSGRFDLDLTTATLIHQAGNLFETIKQHASPDSVVTEKTSSRLIVRSHTEAQRFMDFAYDINIKNLEPLASILNAPPFDAQANLKGSMKGTMDEISITCDGLVDEFYVGSVNGGVLLNNGKISLEANSLSDVNTLDRLSGTLTCSVESGLLNRTSLNTMQFKVDYNHLIGNLSMSGTIDSNYTFTTAGKNSVQSHAYVFDLDTFTVSTGNYAWHNEQDVQFRLSTEGVRVMHAVLRRNDESFSLSGALHANGSFDMNALLRRFNLNGINLLTRNRELSQPDRGFTGRADADLHLGGLISAPLISFSVVSDSTYFRQTRIGTITSSITYENQLAAITLDVKGSPTDTLPTLNVKGTLPINLSLSDVSERFPDREQHLQIWSDGFDLSVLDPILADLDNLSGTLRSNVTLAGTPRAPQYDGTITLNDVRFLFGPNNIAYTLSGELQPSGNKIEIKSLTVKNIPEHGLSGEAQFTGSISVKDFQIASFDLTVNGQLLLMTDATRRTIPTMYGILFTEIGSDGLRVTGTLDRPYLSGKLFVRNANLVFPPARTSVGANSNLSLNYIIVDDTSSKEPLGQKLSKFYLVNDSTTISSRTTTETRQSPLLDRLRYDLSIETQGTTAIRMIFTPATNEELYAELEGKVNAVNNQGAPTIYGEIAISPRSYYNFFKKFDATGTLKFVGPWDNPELDIHATYEGFRQVDENKLGTQSVEADNQQTKKPLTEQKVIVELNITGKRYEPKLEMGMKVQLQRDKDPENWSTQARGGDVQSDAISFILTGKFRDDLTSTERQNIASNFGSAGVSGLTSNLLSGILTDFLKQEFPFIRRAEISYGGGGTLQESPDLRLSGEAFKGYFRFGGKIFNNLSNANVTYQLNLGDVFNTATIRNLFIEFERRVEGSEAINDDKTTNATNSARLYYRFSF